MRDFKEDSSNMQVMNGRLGVHLRDPMLGIQDGGLERFFIFSKNFESQRTVELNISCPSNFFKKHFIASAISFTFLFKAYMYTNKKVLKVIFRVVITLWRSVSFSKIAGVWPGHVILTHSFLLAHSE